jgi:uncharacterized membrane protein YhdT
MSEKEKNRQIRKEAIVSVILYVAFFIWWYFTGYGIAEKGTTETYTYVFGLPMWFFLSCVVGYALFVAATIIVVKCFFKNFELGPERGEEPDAAESAQAAVTKPSVSETATAETKPAAPETATAETKQAAGTDAVTDAAQPFEKGGEQND